MSHSPLGPSSSQRWINCPGSVRLIKEGYASGVIKPSTSTYSEEGNLAHELAAAMLTGGKLPTEGITDEMSEYVSAYVEFVREQLYVRPHSKLLVEHPVSYTDWVTDGWGTADAIIIYDDHLTVIDLKYGKGVPVNAVENTQALLYAMGTYQSLTLRQQAAMTTISMFIHQPRLDSITEWHISIDEMFERADIIRGAAERTAERDAPCAVGEWCRFCPALPVCHAQQEYLMQTVGVHFENLDTPVDLLTPDQLAQVLDFKGNIEVWLSAVAAYAVELLDRGESVPGYKLVAGRSVRQWASEDDAAAVLEITLGDKAYTKKLISPAQAEKALGKKGLHAIDGLVVKPEGKPALVPETDPRQQINISVDNFNKL